MTFKVSFNNIILNSLLQIPYHAQTLEDSIVKRGDVPPNVLVGSFFEARGKPVFLSLS